MEPAQLARMTNDYIDKDKDFGEEFYEDPTMTIESHWRWVLPVLLAVALPVAATWLLHETSRNSREPLRQSMLNGLPTAGEAGAVGTAGRDRSVAESMVVYSLHQFETSAGLSDPQQLVGRKVQLQVPVAAIANDLAFWVGESDNRLLVVPNRDHRDIIERQAGLIAGNSVAPLDTGKTATITGTIEQMPIAEQTYSWGLTTKDREDLASRGVYLNADRITVE
jgi:hypothetical protein